MKRRKHIQKIFIEQKVLLPGFHINCLSRLLLLFFFFITCRITVSSKRENNEICSLLSNSFIFDKLDIL